MKKKLRVCLVAIAVVSLFAVFTGETLAAWVGSLWGEARVQNPVTVARFVSPTIDIFPGQAFDFGGEIFNHSPVRYGLRPYGWIWWTWETGEEMRISLDEVSEEGEITIPAPSLAAGPPYMYLGTIDLYINGQWQPLGLLFDIEPGQVHLAQIVVTTCYKIEPGKVGAEVLFMREAPVR